MVRSGLKRVHGPLRLNPFPSAIIFHLPTSARTDGVELKRVPEWAKSAGCRYLNSAFDAWFSSHSAQDAGATLGFGNPQKNGLRSYCHRIDGLGLQRLSLPMIVPKSRRCQADGRTKTEGFDQFQNDAPEMDSGLGSSHSKLNHGSSRK